MAEESKASQGDHSDFPDPKGMQKWLDLEIDDIQRAAELRIKDAKSFVDAYAKGEISRDEAAQRSFEYANRWGEGLPGVPRTQGLSDEEIMRRLNEARVAEGLLDKYVLQRRKGGTPERGGK
jgi:hypothetical protein